ncbi:MAG: hypothetical protein U5R31_00425 [Acidimicrobiia bacterium]|nr:hypothetical protein [Acidimicrobiia bacterium]
MEALVIVAVLGLGSYLSTSTPGTPRPTRRGERSAQLLSDEAVSDVSECADRDIGMRTCYRDYFRALMEAEGADVAVAEIDRLSAVDDHVGADCHQITHDLGQDAVEHYGSLAEALAFEASACWSGYYHGVIETELADVTPDELYDVVPTVCRSRRRSSTRSPTSTACTGWAMA